MGRHLHETAFLIVTALFIPVQSRAQSPGQVSGAEAWLKTVPLTTDLQGYYHWRDFSGDSVRTNFYDAKGAAYGGEFTQRHTWIRTFNFNPALVHKEVSRGRQTTRHFSLQNKDNRCKIKVLQRFFVFYPYPFDCQTIPFDSHHSVIFCYRNCYTKAGSQKNVAVNGK